MHIFIIKVEGDFHQECYPPCLHMIIEMIENYHPSNNSDDKSAECHESHSTAVPTPADLVEPQESSFGV